MPLHNRMFPCKSINDSFSLSPERAGDSARSSWWSLIHRTCSIVSCRGSPQIWNHQHVPFVFLFWISDFSLLLLWIQSHRISMWGTQRRPYVESTLGGESPGPKPLVFPNWQLSSIHPTWWWENGRWGIYLTSALSVVSTPRGSPSSNLDIDVTTSRWLGQVGIELAGYGPEVADRVWAKHETNASTWESTPISGPFLSSPCRSDSTLCLAAPVAPIDWSRYHFTRYRFHLGQGRSWSIRQVLESTECRAIFWSCQSINCNHFLARRNKPKSVQECEINLGWINQSTFLLRSRRIYHAMCLLVQTPYIDNHQDARHGMNTVLCMPLENAGNSRLTNSIFHGKEAQKSCMSYIEIPNASNR